MTVCNGGCGGQPDPDLSGYCPVCAALLPAEAREGLQAAMTARSPWRYYGAALAALAAGPGWSGAGIGMSEVAARLLAGAYDLQPGALVDRARLVTVQCSGDRWRITWILDPGLILERARVWEAVMACPDCTSEVRVNDRRDRIRVVHSAGCPWYSPGRVGKVPCGTVVTHRGPYARRPE